MKVLVTGSSGFIGSRLVEALKKKGHQVVPFDRSHGLDVTKARDVKKALQGCQGVIHLAAALDETLGKKKLYEVNFLGTRNLLEEAARQKVKRFVFLSTVGVMGDFKGQADETFPYNPKTAYEMTKAEAEQLVLEFQPVFPVIVLRSAMVYGPNSYWTSIIKLIKQGFPVIGKGKNKFQMIYVDDVVSALVFLLERKRAEGQTFIAAEDHPQDLNGVYRTVHRELGVKGKVKHLSLFLGRALANIMAWKTKISGKKTILLPAHVNRLIRVRHYNTTEIKKLGWKPKVSLEQGMKATVKALKAEGVV